MIDLLNGDALPILEKIDTCSIDLIITSPPYNMKSEFGLWKTFDEYLTFQRKIMNQCERILSNKGSVCFQVGSYVKDGELFPLDVFVINHFKSLGMKLKNRIIWHFGHGLQASKKFSGRYETICWFVKSDDYTFNLDPVRVPQKYPNKRYFSGKRKGELSCNPLGKNPSDVWDIVNVKHNHPEKTEHKSQFPEELVRRLVLSLSNEQDIVLDPFMGSGTTGKISKDLNRSFVGIEIDHEYFQISQERLKTRELT